MYICIYIYTYIYICMCVFCFSTHSIAVLHQGAEDIHHILNACLLSTWLRMLRVDLSCTSCVGLAEMAPFGRWA